MEIHYRQMLKCYKRLVEMLHGDTREVSAEIIQVIRDDIEDIKIMLGDVRELDGYYQTYIKYECIVDEK